MKNKIKLFSGLSIASAVIIPASVLTSCNSNKVESIEMINTKTYKGDDITPLSLGQKEWVNQEEATQAFIDAVTADPSLFAKDMAYGASLRTEEDFQHIFGLGMTLEVAEFGFSKPTFGTTNVWEDGFEDAKYHTISFKEKVHLEYKYVSPSGESDYIRTLNLEIAYENVIFLASEVKVIDGQIDENHVWSVGIIDESLAKEAFWMYEYNSNPWSIKYGLSDETDRTLKGLEGAEDVHIHNCSYYSGTVDNPYKMFTLYQYANQLEEHKSDISEDDKLQWHLIDTVLSINQKSKLLSKLWNSPDVCLQHQLSENYNGGNHEFSGVYLIETRKPNYNVTGIQLNEDDTSNIIAKNISDPDKYVEIGPKAVLSPFESSYSLRLPFSIEGGYAGQSAASFMLYRRQFKVRITYSNTLTGENGTLDTTLNLHYNTVKINFVS